MYDLVSTGKSAAGYKLKDSELYNISKYYYEKEIQELKNQISDLNHTIRKQPQPLEKP